MREAACAGPPSWMEGLLGGELNSRSPADRTLRRPRQIVLALLHEWAGKVRQAFHGAKLDVLGDRARGGRPTVLRRQVQR